MGNKFWDYSNKELIRLAKEGMSTLEAVEVRELAAELAERLYEEMGNRL